MPSSSLTTGLALGAGAIVGASAFVAPSAKAGNLRAPTQHAVAEAALSTPVEQPTASAVPWAFGAGACLALAAGSQRKQRAAPAQSRVVNVARRALDQSSRYADLSLVEEDLIKGGKHVLVAYIMKPKAGYDYLATAAHFSAESSTGTNVNVCTTDDFTKSVDALVYYIDPENEEMKIAYPNLLFDRNIIDGRGMMCSVLTLTIGNNQGMGDVEYGKIYDIYCHPGCLSLFEGPSC